MVVIIFAIGDVSFCKNQFNILACGFSRSFCQVTVCIGLLLFMLASLVTLLVDRGMSWEKAKARLENHPGKHSGFYCSQRDVKHKRFYILATPKEGSSHLYKISRFMLIFCAGLSLLKFSHNL